MSLLRLKKVDTKSAEWRAMLQEIVKKCTTTGDVYRIYVFGSFATGNMSEESDLDIAVILSDSENVRKFRSSLPNPLCPWPMDLVVVKFSRFEEMKNVGGVLFDIDKEGIELFPQWKL